jgi:DNA-binding response OmpR family regulator
MRVLLVEDDESLQRLGARTMAAHEITITPTGEEASELLARNTYDVVLIDGNLAGTKSGIDLLHELTPGQLRKAIFISSDEALRRTALEAFGVPSLDKITSFKYVRDWTG